MATETAKPNTPTLDSFTIEEANSEMEKDTSEVEVNMTRERIKCLVAVVFVVVAWASIFIGLSIGGADFQLPGLPCDLRDRSRLRTCDECGQGTLLMPFLGEYEQSWNTSARIVLYIVGILCIFMGVGIVCDQFMAAIEEITSSEQIVWREVHTGSHRKFRVKIWNDTVANITLMALGSSAPEILLSATELIGRGFRAGKIGPLTIVGSAAFNLFVISAVCVSAIPYGDTRKIEGMDAFKVTASVSIFAYLWLICILLVITPGKVDLIEGIATLAFFPALVIAAFCADKGWLRFRSSKDKDEDAELAKQQEEAMAKFGKQLPLDTLKLMKANGTDKKTNTRVQMRKAATSMMTGGTGSMNGFQFRMKPTDALGAGPAIFGFAESKCMVLECCKSVQLKVVVNKQLEYQVQLRYFTREGTAKQDERFTHVEGELIFGPEVNERIIEVPIIDDDVWQAEEEFFVELVDIQPLDAGAPERKTTPGDADAEAGAAGASGGKRPSQTGAVDGAKKRPSVTGGPRGAGRVNDQFIWGIRTATVTVLNDDIPGTLAFDVDEVITHEGTTATLGVVRTEGWCGEISCSYETVDDSAVGDKDFTASKGTVTFAAEEKHRTIEIPILPSDDRGRERFKVLLSNASPGVLFDAETDGGDTSAVCDVVISAKGHAPLYLRIFRTLFNHDRLERAQELWSEQCAELLYCGGSAEEQSQVGWSPWLAHIISLIWKIAFVAVPPPMLGGGWPCFFVALFSIGLVTALAGDIASLLGCVVGIPDEITAITLVALGTSLPDTLASRSAAVHDDTADNAVGNVTGSNSVNVFLGCGISWTMASLYWRGQGMTPEWREQFEGRDDAYRDFYALYPEGGFYIAPGTIAFSVAVYVACALLTLAILAFRRVRYGGELGGPKEAQIRDSSIFFSLWVVFIIAVIVMSLVNQED